MLWKHHCDTKVATDWECFGTSGLNSLMWSQIWSFAINFSVFISFPQSTSQSSLNVCALCFASRFSHFANLYQNVPSVGKLTMKKGIGNGFLKNCFFRRCFDLNPSMLMSLAPTHPGAVRWGPCRLPGGSSPSFSHRDPGLKVRAKFMCHQWFSKFVFLRC